MARVGRLAGAILAETGGDYYLVGNPKQPCDWRAAGFEPPAGIDERSESWGRGPAGSAGGEGARPLWINERSESWGRGPAGSAGGEGARPLWINERSESWGRGSVPAVRLARCGTPALAAPVLELDVEGEPLTRLLADAFVIARTGSVSERLWRLVIGLSDDSDDDDPPAVIAARWLGEMPPAVWRIVRDTVLRCT
jgi:hypothetical protein